MKTLHTTYTNFAKRVLISLFTLVTMGVSTIWADTWTWTVSTANDLGTSTSYEATLNNKTWLVTRSSVQHTGKTEGCIQFGKSGGPETVTLKSSSFAGTIKSISVECASYQGLHSISIKVGETTYLSSSSTPSWTTISSKKGEGDSSGEIQILFKSGGGSQALYIKSITIEYYPEGYTPEPEPDNDACGWVETTISSITASDIVVITMTNSDGTYAMSNNNGTESAPTATKVVVNGDKLEEPADELKWNISTSNESFTIYPYGSTTTWLYCTNTNNGTRVGTNTNKTFTIDATSGYLKHSVTSRYIGVYNNADWRCYTSVNENIKNQTLKFYKYVECGPTETNVILHPNGGTPNEEITYIVKDTEFELPKCPFNCTGHTFGGWATTENGSAMYSDGSIITGLKGEDVNLYAKWTPVIYDITYKDQYDVTYSGSNEASLPKRHTYATATKLADGVKAGYTFVGWYDNPECTGTAIDQLGATSYTDNITLYAKWRINSHKVTWKLAGGKIGESNVDIVETYNYGATISKPDDPTRDGFNFAGWKEESTNEDVMATMPDNDLVYIAQWTAKPLTNYRTLCCTPLEAPTGLTATPSIKGGAVYWSPVTGATSYEVTYDGGNTWHTTNTNSYVIDGIECGHVNVTWQVRAIGDGTTYCDEGPASDEHTFQTSECACPDTYSFHYSNESVWNDDEIICFAPVTGDENNYLTENISLPYAQQYKVAWESKDQIKDVNADWSSVPTEFASNMPFYHNRDKKFGANPQNGNLGGGKGRFHVYHDSKSDNKFISFIPTGYTLNFGSGDEWTNYQTLNFLPKTSNWNETEWYTELITLTNDHLSKQLFVGLETENGYVWCDPYSEKTNLTGLRTKTGAEDNWVTGGMSTSYANKTGKFRIYADSGDKNWYVTFVPHYQLHYNANGGSGSMASLPADAVSCEESDVDRTVTIDACTFNAPAGHYFTGWNTKADGTGTPYSADDNHTLTGDITLYAQWSNLYTLEWDFQEGTPSHNNYTHAGEVAYGTTLTAPTLTREGYTFVGWEPVVPTTMPAEDITYVAQWRVNTYTVTWVPNGGNWDGSTNSKVDTYNYGASITKPADPTRTGYTFASWSPTPAVTMPAANQTYTAQWNCVAPTIHIEGEYVHFPGDDITLTVVGDNIADDATYVWKQGETLLPDQTTATLTINHCDVKHAGNYVCTVTNGTCSAEANFTVKIFHLYGLKDNTWTQPYVFMKDAEANKAILYVDLDAGTSYEFKLINGREWYWNEGTMTYDNCTNWDMPQEGDVKYGNTKITTTVAGTYAFKLDYTDAANLVLSVVYPAKQMIYLKPGVWNTDGAIFVAHVWTEGAGNDKDIKMTKVNDCEDRDIYQAEIEGAHNRVIFVRCNPSGFNINNIWSKEWNRSSTQWLTNTLPGYQFNIEEWGNGGTEDGKTCSKGSWTTFTPYHTISYNMNGHGTQISDECIKEGNTWSAPTDPTEVGYTFQGWRRPAATGDSKLYKNGQTGYKPTASETLTAQWQINQCVVTWKVNVQEVAKTTVDIANPLTTIPYTPADDALGCCAEKFIGWSTETNPTKSQVYTTASELQNLIGTLAANTTKTFHAVFATPVPGAGTSLVTFSEMGYANEEAVTSVTLGDGLGNGDATITFAKGTAATYSPTYYTIGEAVRTYAGNIITVDATYASTTLTQIDLTFAKGENANTITASTGTITDGVWTGNAQSVTFTIGGTTGHRRIASIAVTTEVTGDKYTNYITKCDLSNSASIGAGTITYANSATAIDTKCGQRSPASKAATLTFASAQNLTCPVTIEATTGFLVSTNRNDNSKYASSIIVKPVKSGTNKGKLPTIYVRYEANFGATGQIHGTISATGSEIEDTGVAVLANVTCTQYTLTVVDHLGNTIATSQHYEGNEVAEIAKPTPDDCSKNYTFDGWSTTEVTYGSLIYNKVSFPFTMPANDVTLYPVYRVNDTEDYHRVTYDLGADNWAGDYVIAYYSTLTSELIVANGKKGGNTEGGIGYANNVGNLSVGNDMISRLHGNQYYVTLEAYNTGYLLKTQDGRYNYNTTNSSNDLTSTGEVSTAAKYLMYVSYISADDIQLCLSGNAEGSKFRYYVYGGKTYFRFCQPDAGYPIRLYKKSPLYTTPLICGSIEAEDAVVTSTAGQTIKVNVPITLESTLGGITTITAESDNNHFTVTPLENVTAGDHTIAVHYKPADDATSDDTEIANITLTASHGNRATATFQVTGRHLPENFVIAAKWGDNWYVLPADMNSESITEGLLIEVDDPADPTKAKAAPNTTKYGLKSVYTSNGSQDRYANNGERLVFVENVDETTPVANQTLYNAGGDAQNSTNTNIQVYAQYKTATSGYYESNPNRYEWIPTTTDLKDYILTSAHTFTDENARTVSLDNHGVFGTLLQDKSYNGMVRLLPVDNFYEPIELQVVEWKENSVSVMYTGAGTTYTTKVGDNEESNVLALSKIDHAVYSLSTADLTTATNQPLIITIKDDADAIIGVVKLTIPAIVATDKSSTLLGVSEENAKATSIVVLDGATLTAATTKYTYDDITVYPGGNLIIDDGKSLGMYTLTLRAGSSWGAAEYENKYPQLLVRGDYSNTSGQINLDYVTTQDYYYPLSVPEQVTIDDIKYPVEIYGSNVEKANKGSFQLKYYDGAQRVAQGSQYGTGWIVVDENTTTTLTPNQGYAIWGIPKKVSVNGATSVRQKYGIHRIPIKKAAGDLAMNEKTNAEIPIKAHGINDANVLPNDKGWNYLGNPYLAQLGGMDGTDDDLQMGLLVQEVVNGQWTGGWVNNGAQVRYVTLTYDCQTFDAKPVAEATIPAFTTFFIQAAQDGAILLTAPKNAEPASIAARRYAAQQETAKEITTGIILTGNDQTDRTGLLIADNFTEEYDFNADLSKFENSGINLYTIGKTGNLAYMAINQALAEQPIPVGYSAPAEGLYTIAFDEDRYNATDISALYLIDYDSNEKTNLLLTDYSFVTAAGTNNQRFALQVAFAPENATNVEWVGDATIQVGVEGNELILHNLLTDAAVHVFDALGRLMYHTLHAPKEMQLTLPTGYYLVRIADKQNAVFTNIVIP